jgi:thioredoxin 1
MSDTKFSKAITDQGFQSQVLEAKGLKLVDVWAEWCGPCRVLGPVVDSLAEEYRGRAEVYKLDADENQRTPAQFGIRGLPTVLFFKDGKLVDQVIGSVPRDVLKLAIERHL